MAAIHRRMSGRHSRQKPTSSLFMFCHIVIPPPFDAADDNVVVQRTEFHGARLLSGRMLGSLGGREAQLSWHHSDSPRCHSLQGSAKSDFMTAISIDRALAAGRFRLSDEALAPQRIPLFVARREQRNAGNSDENEGCCVRGRRTSRRRPPRTRSLLNGGMTSSLGLHPAALASASAHYCAADGRSRRKAVIPVRGLERRRSGGKRTCSGQASEASPSHPFGQRLGAVRQARGARIRRKMGLDPGVRRRGPPVPDLLRRTCEDELIALSARSAAQALLIPVDPDVPVFLVGEGRFQTLPTVLPPVGGPSHQRGRSANLRAPSLCSAEASQRISIRTAGSAAAAAAA